MLVQRTLFAGPRAWVNEDLYATIDSGSAWRSRHQVRLQPGGRISTNTYFGRFAASYWQRWTHLTSLTITGTVEAEPSALTTVLLRASDIAGHQRTVDESVIEGDGTFSFTTTLESFLDGGALWLDMGAQCGVATISNVRWTSTEEVHKDPKRRLAIAICTHNRPKECAATVSTLAADEDVVEALTELYVTDQGDKLVLAEPDFAEATEKLGSVMRYIRQPNLGGSGGFTRGLMEASSAVATEGPADILLMDDDVRVEPETVIRLRGFACFTHQPTIVGAQMLFLYNPDYLLASAEGVDLTRLRRGEHTDPHGAHNVSMVEGPLPERRVDAEYNGWWSCLIPSEAVERMGLPLPFFFQWDDVEYSLRGRHYGVPTVTLPGAAVWHADFYWKDIDGFGHFFAMRNGLITAALDPTFDAKGIAEHTMLEITQEILGMQYGLAFTHMQAVRAFLEGPTTLHDGGRRAMVEIIRDRAHFPDTQPIPLSEMPPVMRVSRSAPEPDPEKEKMVTWKRRVMSALGRRVPGATAVSFEDSRWYNTSHFQDIYVTDASQSSVRHRTFHKDVTHKQYRELKKLMRQFRRHAPTVATEFRNAFPYYTSRDSWMRLYGQRPLGTNGTASNH